MTASRARFASRSTLALCARQPFARQHDNAGRSRVSRCDTRGERWLGVERRVACESRIRKLRLDLNRSSTRASEYISRARAQGRWRSRSSPRGHESTRGLLSSSRRETREVNRHPLSGADDARLGAESRALICSRLPVGMGVLMLCIPQLASWCSRAPRSESRCLWRLATPILLSQCQVRSETHLQMHANVYLALPSGVFPHAAVASSSRP